MLTEVSVKPYNSVSITYVILVLFVLTYDYFITVIYCKRIHLLTHTRTQTITHYRQIIALLTLLLQQKVLLLALSLSEYAIYRVGHEFLTDSSRLSFEDKSMKFNSITKI